MTTVSAFRVSALALTLAAGLGLAACKQEAKLEPGTFNLLCDGIPTTLTVNADNTATIHVGDKQFGLAHTGPGLRYETPAGSAPMLAYWEIDDMAMVQQGDTPAVNCAKVGDAPEPPVALAPVENEVPGQGYVIPEGTTPASEAPTAAETPAAPETATETAPAAEDAPAMDETAPAADMPADATPAENMPAETAPVEAAPADAAPVDAAPADAAPADATEAPAATEGEDTTAPAGQ